MAAPQDDYLKDTSQFDVARKRVQQQSATNLQGKRDALQRRFAQLGNLDSGARLKIEQQAEQEEAANAQNANEGIDAAQQAEMGRRREILQQQQFAAGEAEKGRGFAKGEREAGQLFSGEQSAMARALQEKLTGLGLDEQKAGRLQQGSQFTASLGEQVESRLAGQNNFNTQLNEQRIAADRQQTQNFRVNELARDQLAQAADQFAKSLQQQIDEMNASVESAENSNRKKAFGETLTNPIKNGLGSATSETKNFFRW